MKKSIEKLLTSIAIFCSLLSITNTPALASPWYYPEKLAPNIINPYLTADKAYQSSASRWEKQLVLWEGRIISQGGTQQRRTLTLECGIHRVPVIFTRKVRNLDTDRSGYRVAIKGTIATESGLFSHLDGLSVILISPPPKQSFLSWIGSDPRTLSNYLAWRVALHQPQLERSQALAIGQSLVNNAKLHNLDPLLFSSLIQIESAYDAQAVSPSGAMGMGQLMPFTAKDLNVADPYNPLENLQGSSQLIENLNRLWNDSPNPNALVLASYNAGPNCVKRLGGKVPPYPETINYVYFIGFLRQAVNAQIKAMGISNTI